MPAPTLDPHAPAPEPTNPPAWLTNPPPAQIPQQRQAAPEPPTAPTKPKKSRTWWKVAVGVLVGLILGLIIGGNSATPAAPTAAPAAPASAAAAPVTVPPPAATVVPAPVPVPAAPAPVSPAGPLTSFSNGTYEVGADIVPGKYKTPGPRSSDILDSCYMEVGNGSGSVTGIDQNDNLTGPGVVTLKSGKVFKTSGGCTWTKVG